MLILDNSSSDNLLSKYANLKKHDFFYKNYCLPIVYCDEELVLGKKSRMSIALKSCLKAIVIQKLLLIMIVKETCLRSFKNVVTPLINLSSSKMCRRN